CHSEVLPGRAYRKPPMGSAVRLADIVQHRTASPANKKKYCGKYRRGSGILLLCRPALAEAKEEMPDLFVRSVSSGVKGAWKRSHQDTPPRPAAGAKARHRS